MMKKPNNLTLFIYTHWLFMPVVMGLALCCIAQEPQSSQNVDSRWLNQVKKEEGWLTPAINKLQKTTSVEEMLIDGLVVKKTRLEILDEVPWNFDIYWLDKGSLFVRSVIASARAISSYEHEKKVFAYSASYVPYIVDENGVKSSVGGMFTFYYYDENGDGVFETRHSDGPNVLFIPKWVRPSK